MNTLSKTLVAAAAACAVPSLCLAQTFPLTNPSFESPNVFSLDNEPEGWHNGSNHTGVKRRSNTDVEQGLFPIVARTGTSCVETRYNDSQGPGNGGFSQITTDTLNFFQTGFPYYDPSYNWDGGGIRVAVWYNIPQAQAISDVAVGIKLSIKLANASGGSSPQDAWTSEDGSITGHTNGQWVQKEMRLTRRQIKAAVIDNSTLGAGGYFTLPPNPNRVKIQFFRFNPDGTPSPGTIYWDDAEYEQFCAADFNMDGVVDFFDYLDFVDAFSSTSDEADFNVDLVVDFFDYLDFVDAFSTGC